MEEMQIGKSNRVLFLYSRLMHGQMLRKDELAAEFGVSEKSIQRDLEAIRDFLDRKMAEEGFGSRLVYDYQERAYCLEQDNGMNLSNEEILAISKILLESRAFTRREMEDILDKLVVNCVPKENRRLVNDMLLLSGSDNHRFPISKEPVELDTLLMNTCESFESMAREKSLSLSIGLPENILPPCSCDPGRIQQVVSILLHNAISYTREGGKINLSLSYQKTSLEKGNFSISVKDNGIGISNEDKKKIFDRFYRGDSSRSGKEHFGLGLSIAAALTEIQGIELQVEDTKGGGSTFSVIFGKSLHNSIIKT